MHNWVLDKWTQSGWMLGFCEHKSTSALFSWWSASHGCQVKMRSCQTPVTAGYSQNLAPPHAACLEHLKVAGPSHPLCTEHMSHSVPFALRSLWSDSWRTPVCHICLTNHNVTLHFWWICHLYSKTHALKNRIIKCTSFTLLLHISLLPWFVVWLVTQNLKMIHSLMDVFAHGKFNQVLVYFYKTNT